MGILKNYFLNALLTILPILKLLNFQNHKDWSINILNPKLYTHQKKNLTYQLSL